MNYDKRGTQWEVDDCDTFTTLEMLDVCSPEVDTFNIPNTPPDMLHSSQLPSHCFDSCAKMEFLIALRGLVDSEWKSLTSDKYICLYSRVKPTNIS